MRKFLAFFIAITTTFALFGGDIAAAQEAHEARTCVAPQRETSVPPPGRPVDVKIGVIFNDILEVSDAGQYMDVDIGFVMHWKDERLADYAGCFLSYASIWTPRIELINSSKLKPKYTQARNQVQVLEGGQIRYLQRFEGHISTYHQLHRFPFDEQLFDFRLISTAGNADTVRLIPDEAHLFIGKRLNIEDWSFTGISATTSVEEFAAFEEPESVLRVTLSAQRHLAFYIFKVIMPLFLIVSMSWIVFWIPPEKFETQVGFGATSMLTLIAFQFSMVNSLPKLSYFTSMDYLVLGATVLVYAAMAQALITGMLFKYGYETRAQWVETTSRWLFPLLLVTYWALILFNSTS